MIRARRSFSCFFVTQICCLYFLFFSWICFFFEEACVFSSCFSSSFKHVFPLHLNMFSNSIWPTCLIVITFKRNISSDFNRFCKPKTNQWLVLLRCRHFFRDAFSKFLFLPYITHEIFLMRYSVRISAIKIICTKSA